MDFDQLFGLVLAGLLILLAALLISGLAAMFIGVMVGMLWP